MTTEKKNVKLGDRLKAAIEVVSGVEHDDVWQRAVQILEKTAERDEYSVCIKYADLGLPKPGSKRFQVLCDAFKAKCQSENIKCVSATDGCDCGYNEVCSESCKVLTGFICDFGS